MIPPILVEKAGKLEAAVREKFPALAPLARQCFLNTIETTVTQLEDGSYFVITGDIPAMWLRDSAAQLRPYVKYAKEDDGLRDILRSVLQKYAFYINLDPYANAFNSRPQPGYSEHDYSSFHTPGCGSASTRWTPCARRCTWPTNTMKPPGTRPSSPRSSG